MGAWAAWVVRAPFVHGEAAWHVHREAILLINSSNCHATQQDPHEQSLPPLINAGNGSAHQKAAKCAEYARL